MYYIYIIECENGALYTGITPDLRRRMEEHASRGPKCAKYTRSNPFRALRAAWETEDRSAASRFEYAIKRLARKVKLQLVADPARLGRDICPHLGDIPCSAVITEADKS